MQAKIAAQNPQAAPAEPVQAKPTPAPTTVTQGRVTRSMRQVVSPAPAIQGPKDVPLYHETQVGSRCLVHALNNALQRKMFVVEARTPDSILLEPEFPGVLP